MDDQVADQVTNNMGKESVSIEISDLAPLKPNKLLLKLKISKNLKSCDQQHVCPVCSKGFNSGKALGGHIRIHMKGCKNGRHGKISKRQPRNIIHCRANKSKKRISKMTSAKATDGEAAGDDPAEKVSCCICNKDFKSMKSLFGHMRNHPERNWRGIRPPPVVSDKNSCCSSVSENDEALEVNQISSSATQKAGSISDLLKSLPTWTNTAKRCEKLTSDDHDNEIPEAAYCLMKLARGDSFDLDHSSGRYQTKNPSTNKFMIDKNRSSMGKGKAKLKTESDQDDEEQKMEKNGWFDQFEKFPMKAGDEEKVDPSTTMEGRYRGNKMFPSSQTLGFYPKNPSGTLFEEAPLNETAASAPLIMKTPTQAAAGSQVCFPKMLDFDLNEPYVALDGETT